MACGQNYSQVSRNGECVERTHLELQNQMLVYYSLFEFLVFQCRGRLEHPQVGFYREERLGGGNMMAGALS